MTRQRKRIIIAIQLAAIILIGFQYLRAQSALAGIIKIQTSAVHEELTEMIETGVVTLSPDTYPEHAARRIAHRVINNDDFVVDRCQKWQPIALLILTANLILVACTKTHPTAQLVDSDG